MSFSGPDQEPATQHAPAHPDAVAPPLLAVRGLEVALPGGTVVVTGVDVDLHPGRIVTLLGPSGAGKTTFVRALFSPEELTARGYAVRWDERSLHAEAAFVPQRGALFDHLDVPGNVALAQLAGGQPVDPDRWLEAVDLAPDIAAKGRSVATLSGGQAQRVAIARTLASGRKVIVLDEPSVGLDPLGVRLLAQLLVKETREQNVAVLLITHDIVLAAGASDVVYFLDPAAQRLRTLRDGDPGPAETLPAQQRRAEVTRLEGEVERLLAQERPAQAASGAKKRARSGDPGPFRVAGAAIARAFSPTLFGPSQRVFARALAQALLRPLLFYGTVGALLGFTVLYVIAKISQDVQTGTMLQMVGGTYILSLAPPLSAILFAATSGNAVNAWLGSMQLNRQVMALEGIGVSPPRYLWSPAWCALVLAYLATVATFVAAMTLGGWVLFAAYGVPHALPVLTSDFLDPAPDRVPFLVRGAWLVVAYAVAIASIVVSRGMAHKDEAHDVTSGMTGAVIRSTLFVVAMELASVALLFATRGAGR